MQHRFGGMLLPNILVSDTKKAKEQKTMKTHFTSEMLPLKRRNILISECIKTSYIFLLWPYLIIKKKPAMPLRITGSLLKKRYYLQALSMPHIKIEVITQ